MNNGLLEKLVMKLLDSEAGVEAPAQVSCVYPWEVGKNYFIRTVTMHLVGRLIAATDKELILSNASWVANSGRFYDALKGGGLDEVEPFVNDVIVNRASVIDATVWDHALPENQK